MKLSGENIWNFSFLILCIAGCSYQVQNVILSYFSYGTVTRNKYIPPDYVTYPELHYCFRYLQDAIDWKAVVKKYGKIFPHENIHQQKNWTHYLTIKDIFDFTPSLDIVGCLIRGKFGYNLIESDQCNFFDITKYVQQQYVCYRFIPKSKSRMTFFSVHNSLYYERMMYEIRYRGKLSKSGKNRPILSGLEYPHISRAYAPSFYKELDENIAIHVACQSFSNTFLGHPYDNFLCPPKGKESGYFSCFDNCVTNHSMTLWNRKLFYSYHIKAENIRMISAQMIRNETILQYLNRWSRLCHKSCRVLPCKYNFCITNGRAKTTKISGNDMNESYIRVESNPYPNIYINYVPSLPFLDFIIYVFSSLGTWFGFVIIKCNPFAIFKRSYSSILDRMNQAQYLNIFANTFNMRMNRRPNRRDLMMRRMRIRARFYQQHYRQRQQNGE